MSTYTDAVECGLAGMEHVSTGPIYEPGTCPDCEGHDEDAGDEGHFSWHPCGICHSRFGGTRYVWHWVDNEGNIRHENDACTDCVVYLANGDEPEGE